MDIFSLILQHFVSFILIISFIVFIHEYGHYWVAKRCGVHIEAFSIGFGPELWGWNDQSGTRWKICAVPLGGYVKMFGDENAASAPDAEKVESLSKAERARAFPTQSLPNRFAIVTAGPAANFLLAIAIFTGFFSFYGRVESDTRIASVTENSAAEQAGLQAGDRILAMKGEQVSRFSDIRAIASLHPDVEMELIYARDGQENTVFITPRLSETTDVFGNSVTIGLIGIRAEAALGEPLPLHRSFLAAVHDTYDLSVRTLQALGQIITGQRSAEELSGILRIAQFSGQSVEKSMEQGDIRMILWWMAILSTNLGLINLLPIPMLDGGHLFLYSIEAVRRKPLSLRVQEAIFRVGFVLLMGVMALALVNDLRHFGIL